MWRPASRKAFEGPVVQGLLRGARPKAPDGAGDAPPDPRAPCDTPAPGGPPEGAPGALPEVVLFCRTGAHVPYVFCGRLGDLVVDATANARRPEFSWVVHDHDALRRSRFFDDIVRRSTGRGLGGEALGAGGEGRGDGLGW